MHETDEEIRGLQDLIDRSHERANEHAKSILTPDRRLNARQLVRLMGDQQQHLALATVSSSCEPRVSPVDGFLLHGVFYGLTSGASLRARHLRARPAVSMSCFRGEDFAVTVHGRAELVDESHPHFATVDTEVKRIYGASLADWGEGNLAIRVHAERMLTFAAAPQDFPE